MNLLHFFKEYLLTRDTLPSKATVKNYLSDVRKFILWYESTYHIRFDAQKVTSGMVAKFREDKLARIRRGHSVLGGMSASSVERYTSSLRKFFSCLKENGLISTSPFDMPNEVKNPTQEDVWHLKAFKNDLFIANTSDLTIKNYIIDIRQFLSWAQEVTKSNKNSYIVDRRPLLEKITPELTEEYKYRLLHHLKLSPVSINRKLSSLRKYLSWASDEGLLATTPLISSNISEKKILLTKPSEEYQNLSETLAQTQLFTEEAAVVPREKSYSRFPPLRLFQKLGVAGSVLLDFGIIIPLAFLAEKVDYVKWVITGQKLFSTKSADLPSEAIKATSDAIPVDPLGKIIGSVPNFKKSFYAPLSISTEAMPLHKRIIHTIRYTRPKWYKKYHSYTFVHYAHFALLIVFMSGIGTFLYRSYTNVPQEQSGVLAANVSPPRVLSFQGRLTDSQDSPITAKTNLRFGIYNSQTASGSALLWQEVDSVTPDENGIFSVLLGNGTTIPQSLFGQNAALYIGISVSSDAELVPRQQIATVAYATNAELLEGMPAITQPNAGTSNVILALDSSGNLTIGGTASPTFQATGGTFTLSGNVLNLTTFGNGNVAVAPGGTGTISLQSPIQNLGNNNTMPGISGAVQFSDNVGIYNTGVQTALSIYQTSSGNVITASQSGNTVFSVNNSGSGYFAQALGVGQQNPSSMLYITSGGDATSATFNSTASTNTIFSFLNNGNQFASLNRNSNGDTQLNTNNTNNIILMPGGNVGIGTSVPSSFPVQIAGNVGPNVDSTYNLGSSSMRWSNIFVNSITAASTLGILSPVTFNNGANVVSGQSLVLSGMTNAGGILYTNSSGTVAQSTTGSSGDCLISQGTSSPAWSPCAAASGAVWTVANGAILPIYSSADLLIGGNSTASAKFGVLNVSSGTPVAYINGNLGVGTTTPGANADIVGTLRASGLITANGGITFGAGQTLTIGGDTIADFVGAGLQLNGTTLETALGTSVDLTSEVIGVLPIGNGGTNSTSTPTSGAIAYGTGTAYAFSSAGSSGQCLTSGGSGTPTWINCSGANYWQLNNGALSPSNTTNDLLLGSSATSSALIKLGGTASATSYFNTGGNVGIGTTAPVGMFNVTGRLTGQALVQLNETGNQAIFTASASGATRFTVNNNGTVNLSNSGSLNYINITNSSGTGWFGVATNNIFAQIPNASGAFQVFNNTGATARFVVEDAGNVGIGTTAPTTKLDVNGLIRVRNPQGETSAPTRNNNGEFAFADVGGSTAENRLYFRVNGANYFLSAAGTGDYSEFFLKDDQNESFQSGLIVTLESGRVNKTTASASPLGVVSAFGSRNNNDTQDGMRHLDPKYVNIGLLGQLPIIVSSENGSITPGDRIGNTTSAIPGVGTKAFDNPQYVVGRAIQAFTPSAASCPLVPSFSEIPWPEEVENLNPENLCFKLPDGTYIGKIMSYVSPVWYDPDVYITDAGVLNIEETSQSEFRVKRDSQTINRIGGFKDIITGTIEAGLIEARDLTVSGIVNTTQISAESITIAGMSLRDYILTIVEQTNNDPTIISPVVKADRLATNVISPLSSDTVVVNGRLTIRHPGLSRIDSGGANASQNDVLLDVEGSASIAGTLKAQDASIAGTLKTNRLETDELALSDDAVSKLKDQLGTNSATIVNNITNVYQSATPTPIESGPSAIPTPVIASSALQNEAISEIASSSATPIPSPEGEGQGEGPISPTTLTAQTDYADISSMSGILAYVPSLSADFATFTQGLMAFGPSSLSDTSVTGNLTVNGNMILAENSINVLGADLQIQPLRQGNVSFMSGLVKIDIDGNMSVEGDATFSKKVAIRGFLETNFISPIPGEDLVIKLPFSPLPKGEGWGEGESNLVIQNASGSGVLKINQLGDLIASGSGTFKNLSAEAFKIIRGAQADTSLTETVATASAGTAIIGKNQSERTIYSPFVKEDSLIYITPNSNTEGLTPYIARQTAEDNNGDTKGSFTIQLSNPAPADIKVNWWIVN